MSELKRVPKLANQIFVKADDECETLKAHLTELGVIDATFEMKVIKPKAESAAKADAPAVTEAAAPERSDLIRSIADGRVDILTDCAIISKGIDIPAAPEVMTQDEPAPAVEHIRSRGKHAA